MFENLLSVSDGDYCAKLPVIWAELRRTLVSAQTLPGTIQGSFESPRLSTALLGAVRWGCAKSADAWRTHAQLRFGLTIDSALVCFHQGVR